MAKRVKMHWSELPDWYASYRVQKVDKTTGKKVRGTLYKLCENLSDDERKMIESYRNTEVVTTVPLYAPEQRCKAVVIFDKCIRSI